MSENAYQDRLKAIGKRIKELRIKAGFTSYEKFAVHYDLERKQYWRLEEGANMKLSSLFRILDIHGITLADFFKGI